MHAVNTSILDPAFLEQSLEINDWAILEDFYTTFLQQLCSFLEVLDEEGASMSVSELRHQAHKLRSSCRTVGANPLAQLFEDLEELHRGSAISIDKGVITERIRALGQETAMSVESLLEARAEENVKDQSIITQTSTSGSHCNTEVKCH